MPPLHIIRVPSNMGYKYFRRNMRTFNVSFLMVLSCIAIVKDRALEVLSTLQGNGERPDDGRRHRTQ